MGNLPGSGQHEPNRTVMNVVQIVIGAAMFSWAGNVFRDEGRMSFDSHFVMVYTILFFIGAWFLVNGGFVQFGRKCS